MVEIQGGDARTRAAASVDREHREQHQALIYYHRHEEQAHLRQAKRQLGSFDDNQAQAEQRYVQRMRSIEEKRDRIADRLHRQHNSVGGRLQAMTKAGRAKQAVQLDRLDDRAAQLQSRATRQFQALTERQFQVKQSERIWQARHLKLFRAANLDDRQKHMQDHEQKRPWKIEDRVQTLRQVAEQDLKQALRHDREQAQSRNLSR
jgi:hypothetical protein